MSNSPTIREQMINRGLIRENPLDYKDWITKGFQGERGIIEISFKALGFGIIQPQRFPERRLLVALEDVERYGFDVINPNCPVELDLEPQPLRKSQLPQVSACRLLLPRGNK